MGYRPVTGVFWAVGGLAERVARVWTGAFSIGETITHRKQKKIFRNSILMPKSTIYLLLDKVSALISLQCVALHLAPGRAPAFLSMQAPAAHSTLPHGCAH